MAAPMVKVETAVTQILMVEGKVVVVKRFHR